MLSLGLPEDPSAPLKILCLGAHSDDIEIGCGGTILRLLSHYANVEVVWVVFSSGRERELEARASAALFLKHASSQKVMVKNFRDGFFPYAGAKIKEFFEEIKKEVNPDLIFTHYRCDRHQDHRTISDLTWNTWRQHLILEYEIPKYDGDLGSPNCFVPLNQTDLLWQDQIHLRSIPDPKQQGVVDRGYFSGIAQVAGSGMCRTRTSMPKPSIAAS